jgi:hypothetical protein
MSDLDVLVKRTACPVCLHRVSVKQDGQLRSHGPRGSVCPGSNGTIGYRYRVTDSTLAEVPVGTHLIYAHYRGRTDQQDVVNFLEGTHDGGWFMEFMDMGVKFEGHWYLLDGTSEAAHNDTPSESTNPAAIGSFEEGR